jgi:hypothetical protein
MSIARHHAEWLSLVPVSGPFLSLPVLMEAFNTGLEPHDPDLSRLLRQEYGNWQESFEKRKADPAPHYNWIKFVLTKTLELDDRVLAEGQAISQTLQAEVPEHHELLRPNIVLIDPNSKKPRLFVQVYPRSQELTSYVVNSRWKASPDTRMTELLHATGVRLGLATNGEHWMLVDAPKGETTGYSSWYASLWLEEKITLQAFRSLLSAGRFFGDENQTLEVLFTKSANNQQEVADQLGYQVRRAVEVLIHEIAKIEHEPEIDPELRKLISEIPETVLYESGLTVMMRLVFLFCAEERELIPTKPFPVYEQNYSVSTISKQLRELADQHDEALLERRYDAWPRLLSAFRAVYGGLQHDDVHIPAYGGSLFNPDRFPFLEGRKPGSSWRDTEASPLPVNNRTVLHLLEALQLLQIKMPGGGKAEARRLSFRALDIEQIGHVYEGLLDHTAKRATEPFLGLAGTRDKEPEIPLADLEKSLAKGEADLIKFLKEETGKQEKALSKLLKAELDSQDVARFRTVCQGDEALWKRVQPFAGLVRLDNFDYPVVIPKGHVFVTAGTDRRSSGTHYTRRDLTIPIVRYTLEPLVFVGPADGKLKGEWKLKSAKELLDLKICDMACGSGAFLVQAARYMAERLMEAWDQAKQAHSGIPGITPEGEPSTGKFNEALIPDDPAERKTYAMRIIAQRCLYGVDINPLAAEMAKLSLWLLTLAKDKAFEFLDHSIRCGDSLVGIHTLGQLRHFSLKPDVDDSVLFGGPLDNSVDEAIALRLKLEDLPANTVEDVERQEKLLNAADEKIARLRCSADLLVGAEFWGMSPKDKQERVRHAAVVSGHYIEKGPTEEFQQAASKERRGQKMFHWPLEFPEVIVKRGGFDAFVGNPPFITGTSISSILGQTYREYIKCLWEHYEGRADICVAFLLRATSLMRKGGCAGIIGTDTVSEGDSRISGPAHLLKQGISIYRAVKRMKWPGTAAVMICQCHVYSGLWQSLCVLDGVSVPNIDSAFDAALQQGEPNTLQHSRAMSFTGTKVYGNGFVLSVEEANEILANDSIYSEVVKPYLVGRELNEVNCVPGRFIIDLTDMNKEAAQSFPLVWKIIEQRVREERATAPEPSMREKYWQFQRPRRDLYAILRLRGNAWLVAATSDTVAFVAVQYSEERPIVFSHAVNVLTLDGFGQFAAVQSSLHLSWARRYGSSMKGDLRYTTTDCFETFPFPSGCDSLEEIGRRYYSHRATIAHDQAIGLTDVYHLMHRKCESYPIDTLRSLHVEMDQAVAAAFGWNDLDLGHGFHETNQGVRFAISESARREVLQRLLKLNHERYAEEVEQGLHGKNGAVKKLPVEDKPKKPEKKGKAERTLFDDATFPSSDRDHYLCGLLCELIKAEPGLPLTVYVDSLVIALGYDRYKLLLTGKDRSVFAKLCKASPVASWTSADKIPWGELENLLTRRKAIKPDAKTIQAGPDLANVRKSYPAVAAELITLLRKAAAELRNLQSQAITENTDTAQEITPEKVELLKALSHDRERWLGVAA